MAALGPALVAVGYNRPEALRRLLDSLAAGSYAGSVPLVVSLDHSGDPRPGEVADGFVWPHGPKRVIRHPERLGLRHHILSCGDLTRTYGAIVLFEDDIVVAPHHYDWVRRAIDFYGDDARIGGMGLYSYRLNEFNNMDFEPIDDGSDVYFLQVAASWGQAWTVAQWERFRAWYDLHQHAPIGVADRIPRQLAAWRDNSWKKYYIKYLTATDRTFVFPRPSLTTNMARPGTNTKRDVSIYQVPMDLRPRDWRLMPLDRSLSRYDVFFEPLAEVLARLNPALGAPDFDVDLFGTKPAEALTRPRLLSARPVRRDAALGFATMAGAAPAAAIVQAKPGRFFALAPRAAFGAMTLRRRYALARDTQIGRTANNLLFQTLKPMQTALMLRKARHAAASAARG